MYIRRYQYLVVVFLFPRNILYLTLEDSLEFQLCIEEVILAAGTLVVDSWVLIFFL